MVLALFALACNLSTTFAASAEESNNQPKQSAEPVIKKAEFVKAAAPVVAVKKTEPVKTEVSVQKTKIDNRYRETPEFTTLEKAGFTQSKYKGPETINGLGLKTAAELGLDGKKVYNEYERSARIVILSPFAKIYYDTGSFEPVYLYGCLRDGKPFANRIKLLEPLKKAPEVVTVPAAVPVEKPLVYQLPKDSATVVVQEKDILVPIYYPKYAVTVHKQNIVYQPEPRVIPVQVYERPRMIVSRNSGTAPSQSMRQERCQPTPRCR